MAEQKKTTGAPTRKRTVAAKAANPTGSVTEKPAAPARATKGSKRKQVAAVEAPLFDAAAMEAAIAVAMPPEPAVPGLTADKAKAPAPAASQSKAVSEKASRPSGNFPIVARAPAQVVPFSAAKATGAQAGPAPLPYATAQAASASLRRVVAEATAATTSGALEVNDKVLDAWRAQSDAILDVWRAALAADTLSDAARLQATGAREAYAAAASHWKDVAETTTRWFEDALKPFRSALTSRAS